jgi:hypothetical protein
MYTAKKQLIIVYSSLGIGWLLLMFAIFTLILSGCSKNPYGGSGHVITEERHPGNFTDVTVDGPFIVYLEEAANTQVAVNAEDNLMQFIETYISGTTLHIKLKKNVQLHFFKDIKIYLKSPVYHTVNYSGNGFVQSIDTLHTDHFFCTINGVNNATLAIVTPKLEIALNGNGHIDLSGSTDNYICNIKEDGAIGGLNLTCADASIDIDGSGKQTLSVSRKLDVSIQGSGNVGYRGDPSVNSDIQGSGAVIKL